MWSEVLGRIIIPDDSFLQNIRDLCDEKNWCPTFCQPNVSVFARKTDSSDVNIFKLVTSFRDVSMQLLFDTLMDSEYRKQWDKNMIESYELCCVNPNNDIGYYSVKSFPAIKDRDFVLQRSWLQTEKECIIFSRSVFHNALPPRKEFIRAISFLTAYRIRPHGANTCDLTYLSHCDPRGKLPSWAVNKVTHFVAPRVLKRIAKACLGYESWKKTHRPGYKPWQFPEQCELPRLNWSDVPTGPDIDLTPDVVVDESQVADVNGNSMDKDDDSTIT